MGLIHTAKIKWFVYTHIRLPQLQPSTRECAVTCSAIRSLYSGSQANFFLFGVTRNKIPVCVTNCPNGSFLSSEIGAVK